MTKKPRKGKKVVKLVRPESENWRVDLEEGSVIVLADHGKYPTQEEVNLLLDKAKIFLMSDEIREASEEEP